MSKQSEAKEKQNYCAKPVPRTCANCGNLMQNFYHYDANNIRIEGKQINIWRYAAKTYSDNLRCCVGRFAVKKTATCNRYEAALMVSNKDF